MSDNDMKDENITAYPDTRSSRRVPLYLTLVFVLTYLYEYIFVIRFLNENTDNTIASISMRLAAAMFIPALCVIISRVILKEGFADSYINFNMKEGRYRYYLLAWFSPSVLTLIGVIIYFVCVRGDFSTDMEYIIATYAKQGTPGLTPDIIRKTVISQGITAILLGPLINCLTCFGEEWGFRGYLLPALAGKLKTVPLMIIMGVIWGLWHLPLIVAGHNYGVEYTGYPYLGVIAMIVFCFSIGTLLSYVTLKTGSCIPAVIGHGAINSFSSIGIYFTKTGGKLLLGPCPTGILAGIPCLIFAIMLIWLMIKDEEKQK